MLYKGHDILDNRKKNTFMNKTIPLIGLLCCFVIPLTAQEKVHWMSMNEALEAQKKAPKKILMDAYTDWCPPCKMMDEKTYQNPDVVAYVNAHFYPVKFNAEGREKIRYQGQSFTNPKYDPKRKGKRNHQHALARALKISAYPTTVFFDEDAEVITAIRGYRKAQDFEIYLKMTAENAYKEINSKEEWQDYQKDFEATFKK